MFAPMLGFLLRFNSLAIKTPAGAANAKASRAAMTRPITAIIPIHRNAYRTGSSFTTVPVPSTQCSSYPVAGCLLPNSSVVVV